MRAAAAIAFIAVLALALPSAAQSRRWRDTPMNAPTDAPTSPSEQQSTNPPAAAPMTAPASSTAPVRATGDYLSRMDRDGDGMVSLPEYQDWLSYAFDRMDTNRDGQLASQEQPGGRAPPLTREAHRARVAERFKLQDRNRDGALDRKELAAPPQGK